MDRQEIIQEIQAVKVKLAYTQSDYERIRLTTVLLELYNSLVSIDNKMLNVA